MADDNGLVANHYRIDLKKPGPTLLGGLRSFVAIDQRDPSLHLLAILTKAEYPNRQRPILARGGAPVPHAVMPVDLGLGTDPDGRQGWWVICEGVPGPAIAIGQPWREAELLACVLLPVATALAALDERGLTHRAIHPDNMFRAGPRNPVTIGPFWTAPAGSLLPDVFEPPYMARCLPNGRGDGRITDDVYALGVTILTLFLGRVPLAGMEPDIILRARMELGSFNALTAQCTLPSLLSDLLRGMLAEDPDHRPLPALLLKPEQARARRVAARPPRRAQLPLNIGGLNVWSGRELAHGLSLRPDRGFALLRSGEVERWLRRALGDPQLGMQIEDVVRRDDDAGGEDSAAKNSRAQGLLVMRSIAVIDPLAPMIWRSLAVQPDGVGTAFVGAPPDIAAQLEEIVAADAWTHFLLANPRRLDQHGMLPDQREWRSWQSSRGPAGGIKRMVYGMNPMLVCSSPLLGGTPVVRAADLLPALDRVSLSADIKRAPIDAHIAAFIVARTDSTMAGDLVRLASFAGPEERLSVLKLFARLQARLSPAPLKGLAAWLVAAGFANVDDWRSRKARAILQEKVRHAATAGQIAAIWELVRDSDAREADEAGGQAAAARLQWLTMAIAAIKGGKARRAETARQFSYEIATAGGVIACLGAVIALALGV